MWIDHPHSIAHSKPITLDSLTVITGSFNFTKAADERNVEDVIVLVSPELARLFTANWEARRAVSDPFEAE